MDLTSTHLRYLLAMYGLSKSKREMRLTEIANVLHVKKASAARIITVFREKQLADQELYGKVRLTEQGQQLAAQYERCIQLLAQWLTQGSLLLDEQEAYDAACVLLPELPERCIHRIRDQAYLTEKVVDN